jgi:RNase P/RNase MRP subunit p30
MLGNSVINKVHEMMRRDIQIEVCYGNALTTPKEFTNFITQMSTLMRFTKGKNIILSNGTRYCFKSPLDVANIASFTGHTFLMGKKMISHHIRDALMHGKQRSTIKGIIKVY